MSRGGRWLLSILLLAFAVGLGYAVLSLPQQAPGLQALVADQLDASGVSNPVTAVLLNFRGYDTFLEMVVLLLALLGIWSLAGVKVPGESALPGPVLDSLARVLVPLMLLLAAYLLWAGAHAPGGAFQAGAVLGAGGVLLILAGWRPSQELLAGRSLRVALVAGVVAFLAVSLLTMLLGGRLLEYPPAQAGALIFVIEAAATVAIAVALAAMFLALVDASGGDL
jgi:multisubunit Na+/H+ antiporter MnhB subunit